ncbi:outer membrane lipoprotein SlyB [Undibacterium sp. GrIS 1.2]
MKKIIALTAVVALSACAVPPTSNSVYRPGQTQNEQSVRMGVVESVREVTIDKGQSGVGTVAGAAVGGESLLAPASVKVTVLSLPVFWVQLQVA